MGTTPNYSWAYPTVNADADAWGTILNTMAIAIDASLKTVDDGLAARLAASANLSDLASASTARTNLGLGTAAVHDVSSGLISYNVALVRSASAGNIPGFDDGTGLIADTGIIGTDILLKSANLSGLSSASTSRTNLGLGSIATHNVTISSSAPSGGSNGDFWYVYIP